MCGAKANMTTCDPLAWIADKCRFLKRRLLRNLKGDNAPTIPQFSPSVATNAPEGIEALVDDLVASPDLYEALDEALQVRNLNSTDILWLYIGLSDHFQPHSPLTAIHFLNAAYDLVPTTTTEMDSLFVRRFLALNHVDLATEIAVGSALESNTTLELTPVGRKKILQHFRHLRNLEKTQQSHGHGILIRCLDERLGAKSDDLADDEFLIEVGSTREDVPGQGSTRVIAEFCKRRGIHFVTVDMDPRNTKSAQVLFKKLGVDFEAVNQKGEDFLREHPGPFDYVFLDAYDFDHGKHSELRQSRYEKFLGHRIDDADCHRMHLECAESIASKLRLTGLVCIDDTWQDENGHWTAKGTLAMPYLLENGFRVIEASNRAALLERVA